MPTEAQQLAIVIERIGQDIITQLKGLPDELINAPLPIAHTNTLFALGTHAVGMGEFWVLALAGRRQIRRNRSAEFTASGRGTELIARLEAWIADVHAVLDAMPDSTLEQTAEPPAEFRSTGNLASGNLTVRDCLLHVIEHNAAHLGHMQVSAQVLQAIQEGKIQR